MELTASMEECVNETELHPSSNATVDYHAETLNHVINDIALPAVCAFGIVGNILNLTILTRRKLQKSFRALEQAANLCLIALAVSDLMFCILALMTIITPPDNVYDQQGIEFFYGLYSYFFINVFIMESTMLTVAMSLERYMAICFPLRQDLYLTTRRIKYVIVSTFIFSLIFNIPVIWRFEAKPLCPVASLGKDLDNSNSDPSNFTSSHAWSNKPSEIINPALAREPNNVHNPLLPSLSSSSPLSSIASNGLSSFPSSSFSSSPPPPPAPAAATAVAAAAETSRRSQPSHQQLASSGESVINVILNSSHQSAVSTNSNNASSVSSSSSSSAAASSPPSLSPSTTTTTRGSSSSSPPASTGSQTSSVRYRIQEPPGERPERMAYRIAWAIVGNVIPLILLFFFNVCLCRKIYLSYKMRRQFKRQSRAKSSSHILTLTLVVIVVMFFLLVAPSELLLVVSNTSTTVEPILNFMQSLNFSVNFILYCIISPTFRKTLKYICMCGCYNIYQNSRDWKKEFETSLM